MSDNKIKLEDVIKDHEKRLRNLESDSHDKVNRITALINKIKIKVNALDQWKNNIIFSSKVVGWIIGACAGLAGIIGLFITIFK